MGNIDPVIEPDVRLHQERASYFRKCAGVEERRSVAALRVGNVDRWQASRQQADSFQAKASVEDRAVSMLTRWFVKVPSRQRLVPAFVPSQELTILTVTDSGHIVCSDGSCVGWVL